VVVRVDTTRSAAPTCIFSTAMWPPSPTAVSSAMRRRHGHEIGEAVKGSQSATGFSSRHHQVRRCGYCQRNMPSHCQTVGGSAGSSPPDRRHPSRVGPGPYADTSLYIVPGDVTNEQAIFLADSLPPAMSGCARRNVRPATPSPWSGRCGWPVGHLDHWPVGASRSSRSTQQVPAGQGHGVRATDAVEASDNTVADVRELAGGNGVDVSIEAVGYPETLLTAAALVRPGAPLPTSACTAPRCRCHADM